MWRGSIRFGLSVAAPFVWRCPSNLAITPFPHPLIEPDMQISRIRLSDKTSRLRPRLIAPAQTDKTEVPVKVREWICPAFASSEFVFVAQPPAQPRCRVSEGFSHFVTSMTAPVASGWSISPGGACTHWKAPPLHGAHTRDIRALAGNNRYRARRRRPENSFYRRRTFNSLSKGRSPLHVGQTAIGR